MGWMNPAEQKETLKFYGKQSGFVCDYCHKPIFAGDLFVQDPKGGFHKLPDSVNGYGSRYSYPKTTFHRDCDLLRRGKKLPDAVKSDVKFKGENTMAKKATKEEVVTKKTKPGKPELVKTAKTKKVKAERSTAGLLFGKFRAGSSIGNMVEELVSKGKASEKTLEKLADGANLAGRLFWIRKHGKDSGYYSFFRSKKSEGMWIMKVTNSKAFKAA